MQVQALDQLSAFKLINVTALVSAGTATFAGVDLRDYIGTVKIIAAGTSISDDGGESTMTFSLLDSADNSTFATFAGAPTFAGVTGTGAVASVLLDTRNCKRYIQGKHLCTGATATMRLAMSMYGVGCKKDSP